MSRYNRLYRDRGVEAWLLVVSRYRRDTAEGSTTTRRRERAGARTCSRRYERQGLRHGRAKPATRPGQAYDTAGQGLRHSRAKPTTRLGQACDMATPSLRYDAARERPGCSARSLGAPCAQPGSVGCAHVHPTQIWTQCTVSVTV